MPMGGEPLVQVMADPRGLAGDRWYKVEDCDDRLASGKDTRRFRRRDAVFDCEATTAENEVVVANSSGQWTVGDPALDLETVRRDG